MLQRQFASTGNQWMIDTRWFKTLPKGSLFLELTPFLSRRAFYHFGMAELRIAPRFNIGAETENLHQPGLDAIGGGPRATVILWKSPRTRLAASYAYQFRRGTDWSRVYLVLTTKH